MVVISNLLVIVQYIIMETNSRAEEPDRLNFSQFIQRSALRPFTAR